MAARRFFYVVRWVLLAQLLAALIAGLLGWLMAGRLSGMSALLGGVIALLPNVYFAWKLGVRDDRRTARQVVGSLYGGELIKLLMTAALFAAIFQVPGVRMLPLFGGYIMGLTVFWFALLVRGVNL
jgi:ATP synthase protein I